MSDQTPTVELTSDSGVKQQFGRFAQFRNGKVQTKKMAWISVGVLTLAAVPVLLRGTPTVDEVPGQKPDFTVPDQIGPSDPINLPEYSRADDAKQSESNGRKNFGRKAEVLKGPQMVPRSRNTKIPPGTLVKAVLISGASNGPVKAKLTESVRVNGEVLVEEGTVAFGSGSSTEERLFVRFSKLIYQDGTVDSIQAEAADQSDQIAGLKGSLVGHYATSLAMGIGLNFVGGMSEALQDTEGQQGAVVRKPTVKNALLNGAARASLEQSQDIMSGIKNKQPIIEVGAGTPLMILFTEGG